MQRQTPKEIKRVQKKIRQQRFHRRPTGAVAPYRRVVEPDCKNHNCTRSFWQQPITEPVRFLGERWSAKTGRYYCWEFENIQSERRFCEEHHKDVMLKYLFRQLRLGVI